MFERENKFTPEGELSDYMKSGTEEGRVENPADISNDAAISSQTEGINLENAKMAWNEAYDVLQKVNTEFRGNALDIPTGENGEEYKPFLEAAQAYLVAADIKEVSTPKSKEKDPMVKLAQDIIAANPEKEEKAA